MWPAMCPVLGGPAGPRVQETRVRLMHTLTVCEECSAWRSLGAAGGVHVRCVSPVLGPPDPALRFNRVHAGQWEPRVCRPAPVHTCLPLAKSAGSPSHPVLTSATF